MFCQRARQKHASVVHRSDIGVAALSRRTVTDFVCNATVNTFFLDYEPISRSYIVYSAVWSEIHTINTYCLRAESRTFNVNSMK